MNLNQTFTSAPGTVMHYGRVYMHSTSFHLHTFDSYSKAKTLSNPPVNGKRICMWEGLELICYIVALFPALSRFDLSVVWGWVAKQQTFHFPEGTASGYG